MVKRKSGKGRQHLHVKQWMDHLGVTFEHLADKLETDRTTVWRWANQQHRLNPEKIALLADALGIEPEQFWRLPDRPSVDAILKDEPPVTVQRAYDIVRRMLD